MKSKYCYLIAICALCNIHLIEAQNSNSTTGRFISQVNSWFSRFRGHNNNNNSDKSKENDEKNQQNKQIQYPMMPYPMMPSPYGPMAPMAMPFAPRPMPSTAFAHAIPFGSLAAGSSMGPPIPMGPGIGATYGQLNPSFSSSHMIPVHHDYQEAGQDYPVNYGMANTFGNGFGGLSGNSYGSLSGGPSAEHQMSENTYNAEQVEPQNNDEYSAYQR